jgi:hypothetical protein
VAHRLDQPNKLALVYRELVMASGEGAAEEGQRSLALVEDGAEADAGGVTVHHERHVEVRQQVDAVVTGPRGWEALWLVEDVTVLLLVAVRLM